MIDKSSFKAVFADALIAHEQAQRTEAATHTRKVLVGLYALALDFKGAEE